MPSEDAMGWETANEKCENILPKASSGGGTTPDQYLLVEYITIPTERLKKQLNIREVV
jgi:hypothetical protein